MGSFYTEYKDIFDLQRKATSAKHPNYLILLPNLTFDYLKKLFCEANLTNFNKPMKIIYFRVPNLNGACKYDDGMG